MQEELDPPDPTFIGVCKKSAVYCLKTDNLANLVFKQLYDLVTLYMVKVLGLNVVIQDTNRVNCSLSCFD